MPSALCPLPYRKLINTNPFPQYLLRCKMRGRYSFFQKGRTAEQTYFVPAAFCKKGFEQACTAFDEYALDIPGFEVGKHRRQRPVRQRSIGQVWRRFPFLFGEDKGRLAAVEYVQVRR